MLRKRANATITYAIIGLLIGALAGYLTRPESAEIRIGPVQIEITGKGIDSGGGSLTSDQLQHVLLVGLIGGLLGVGFGFLVDRGKFRA
jgi:F0F1-type ATP synthase assembly protein I